MTPLVGITIGRVPVGPRLMDAADTEYSHAVRTAGGAPALIPASDPPEAASFVQRLDAIVLTGGGDVNPETYGAPVSERCGGIDPSRDETEIAVIRAAIALAIPILGICRGCQMLNVALGGTLIQHLPDVTAVSHLQPTPRTRLVHGVSVDPSSLLCEILGSGTVSVNSIHHQAVDRVAPDLRAVAWSEDGIVEGLEHRSQRVVAVQWHPESLASKPPHASLFTWLVSAAADREVRV